MCRPILLLAHSLVLVVLVGVAARGFEPAMAGEYSDCRDRPDADCLIDIGVALYLDSRLENADPKLVSSLISVGRIDEARAVSSVIKNARPVFRSLIEGAFTRLQLRRALAQGEDIRGIIRETPGISAGILHLTALNLLGHDVDGFPDDVSLHPPGPKERALVADIAAAIIEKTNGMRAEGAHTYLADAANLYAEIGDAVGVREAIARLTPGDGIVLLSQQAFELGGVEEIVANLDRLGLLKPTNLLAAAGAAHDPKQARLFIERAYTIAAGQEPWPDFKAIGRVVERSRTLGHADQALALARKMAVLASETRFPFEVFANLDAAHALLDTGAGSEEVRTGLDRAERLFPADPDTVVAFGLVSGPMRWEGAGLKDEAMARFAYLNARLGDLDRAKRALERIEDTAQWHGLDDAPMPRPSIDAILDFAAERLSADEHAYLVGQTVRMAAILERPATDRDWSLQRARLLFETGDIAGKHADQIYTAIAVVAWQTGDEALKSAALTRRARWALDARDSPAILAAGILFEALRHPPRQR